MGWLGGSSAPQSESVTIPVHRIDRDSLLRKNREDYERVLAAGGA